MELIAPEQIFNGASQKLAYGKSVPVDDGANNATRIKPDISFSGRAAKVSAPIRTRFLEDFTYPFLTRVHSAENFPLLD